MQSSGQAARIAGILMVASASCAGVAQQPPPTNAAATIEHSRPTLLHRPPYLTFRLSPDLGDDLPKVRAALAELARAKIAEPADFEITTKADFTQTLVAVDARQPLSDWQSDFSLSPPELRPRTITLGNLALDDYRIALRDLVDRAARADLLLSAPEGRDAGTVETCVSDWRSETSPRNCHRGAATQPHDGVDQDRIVTATVRNRSNRPRYVALLIVAPTSEIDLVPFQEDSGPMPLAPGSQAEAADPFVYSRANGSGKYVLVTISSDRPIDTRGFAHSQADDEQWQKCIASDARENCSRPAARLSPDWSISIAEYDYTAPRLAAMGGAMSVMDGMAPWIAEIYSTVPYTEAEIAADARKPANEREYLAERSSAERNHRCGGTLIAPNLVLTAAHCVAKGQYAGGAMSKVLKERRVRVDTARLGWGGTTLAIAGVAVPLSYSPDSQKDDIALLLVRPDRATKNFQQEVIRLGKGSIAAGTDVTAFGWGYTGAVAPGADPLFDMEGELQRNPDLLRFGLMRALSWNACKKKLQQKLGEGMVCLVAPGAETGQAPKKNVFSCRGDSGGPLIRKTGNIDELIGVTSWSLGCGYKDIPSVYTDVTKYGRWIAAARQQLKPGSALRVDEKATPPHQEGRRQ